MTNCYSNKRKRSCDKEVYFSDDLPYDNTKGLLQSFLCVNRFHTKGTRPGDWYFPSMAEVNMFTDILIKKECVDGRFADLNWWTKREVVGISTGLFTRARQIINHVRKSLRYETMRGIVISSTEINKNNIQGCPANYSDTCQNVDKTHGAIIFACLRITDVDDTF